MRQSLAFRFVVVSRAVSCQLNIDLGGRAISLREDADHHVGRLEM